MKRFLFLLVSSSIVLASSCTKNETPYEIYFFTSNKNLPSLFATKSNHLIAPVQLRKTRDYITDTSTNKLITFDKEVRIDAVDKNGQVVATTKLNLKDDGTFISTGGGYLHYEIKVLKDRTLVIDYIKQL
ncbi:MAG: hypothetical protein M9931_04105 [Chitinophagales bacterium]|nr:hypothetical protein [Chitinophagales bacterium]MCO5280226.1 hypothetical protein [Chitinophagales bacterium]OJV25236.1 MAG: hypothetical protein BGO32_04685 [Bacteroidetes bacterium 37-13]HRP39397.1 hypothetical protein [Chitinophagales bacterium]